MDSNAETILKTGDWSQAVEVDDSLSPSAAPETAGWSQTKEEGLGGPSIWDPKVEEFLSREELKDDPAMWEHLPKPSFTNNHDWVVC